MVFGEWRSLVWWEIQIRKKFWTVRQTSGKNNSDQFFEACRKKTFFKNFFLHFHTNVVCHGKLKIDDLNENSGLSSNYLGKNAFINVTLINEFFKIYFLAIMIFRGLICLVYSNLLMYIFVHSCVLKFQ